MGAKGQYTVSKLIDIIPVELYKKNSNYGFIGGMDTNRDFDISAPGGGQKSGEWLVDLDESGNLSMMLFHPDIAYKEYKNDLALVNKLSQDSILKITLSLDKKYKSDEIGNILPDANVSEVLIDGYSEEEMNKYKKKAKEYDGKATFIHEDEFIGLGFRADSFSRFDADGAVSEKYGELLNNLNFDYKYNKYYENRFRTIYSTLMSKYQEDSSKVDIIGVVVYGTPEELERLKSNPHIKVSSAGIVTRDIIFK